MHSPFFYDFLCLAYGERSVKDAATMNEIQNFSQSGALFIVNFESNRS